MKPLSLARASSCENKRTYGSWAEAEKVASRMRRNTAMAVVYSMLAIQKQRSGEMSATSSIDAEPIVFAGTTRKSSETHSHNEVTNGK